MRRTALLAACLAALLIAPAGASDLSKAIDGAKADVARTVGEIQSDAARTIGDIKADATRSIGDIKAEAAIEIKDGISAIQWNLRTSEVRIERAPGVPTRVDVSANAADWVKSKWTRFLADNHVVIKKRENNGN